MILQPQSIRPHIPATSEKYTGFKQTIVRNVDKKCTYLHLQFNPHDPPLNIIQTLFQESVLLPSKETPLPELCNCQGYKIGTNKLIVCYHRNWNLRNYLFLHTFYEPINGKVSDVLSRFNNAA